HPKKSDNPAQVTVSWVATILDRKRRLYETAPIFNRLENPRRSHKRTNSKVKSTGKPLPSLRR
ncbi:41643_t:CDS:2, partial [Gigaspora margarita]